MRYVVLLGRICFGAIFVLSAPGHFSAQYVEMARDAGAPFAAALVPLSGVLALIGGLLVMLGFLARIGSWMLVLFLIPVSFMMHDFWNLAGQERMIQQVNFMKNLSMLGGALLITYFGSGPLSLEWVNGKFAYTDTPTRRVDKGTRPRGLAGTREEREVARR